MTPGPLLFARYAYPPNALGYCGPADSAALLDYTAGQHSDAGLAALARRFSGAWPYLTLIAAANRIPDPLDEAVVRAYWLGSPLLERIPARLLAAHVVERFTDRIAHPEDDLAELALSGGRAHHNFHVFCVYPWTGLLRAGHVEQPMRVLDGCRIRRGTVLSVHNGRTEVEVRPLRWTGRELILGAPEPTWACTVLPVRPGDIVSLHWDWVCEVLDATATTSLHRYTVSQLRVANRTLRRPVADRVLG